MSQPYTYGQITKGVDIDTPTITIHGVTEDNYLDLCKANGIDPVVNANGEIIGWQYTQSESELTDEGYIERIYKVQMSAEKDSQSTPTNVIINFVPTENATTSTRYKGSIQVNVNRNDYAKAILKTAGVNLDLATVPDSVIDDMWNRYLLLAAGDAYMAEPPVEGIEGYADWLGDMFVEGAETMIQWLKFDSTDGKYKTIDSVDNLAAILSVAAEMGMFTPEDIFNDDPETKAAMMQAIAGDHIQFKMPTDEDGETIAANESWLPSFLRPMMIAALIQGIRQLPSASELETGFTNPITGTPIWQEIAEEVHDLHGNYPNIWISQIQAFGQGLLMLTGAYFENEEYTIVANYPAYGYADVTIYTNPDIVLAKTKGYNNGQWTSYGTAGFIPTNVMFIYSFADFFAYFESLTEQEKINLNDQYYIFANCTWIPGEKEYISYDPDYIHITPGMTPDDIINILPTERPDWWDDRDTEVTVDPKYPDTPKQKVYLPVGTGNNTPTDGTPDPAKVVSGYPLTIPSITTPINSVPEAVSEMTPTAGSSKFWSVYNPSDANMDSLGGELWQQNTIQTLKQTFVNPTDGIISWHQIMVDATDITKSQTNYNIMLGDYQTGVSCPIITNNVVALDCGILTVPAFFGDYRDITETEVSCYLPYIGFVDLDPRDVIGCKLALKYRIDLLTGTCVANISPSKGGINDSNVSECAYMFVGNCAVELPITAADRSRFLSGMLSGAISGAKAGALAGGYGAAAGAVVGGIVGGVSGWHGNITKTNGLNSNAGALSIYRKPYLIINRNKPADPLGAEYHYGAPASKLAVLRELSGFTRVREAYINIPKATENEKAAIDTILKSGIYLN